MKKKSESRGHGFSGGLFLKIAAVVVPGVLLVSASTLGVALHTTRMGYVDTMSRSSQQILSTVKTNMESVNDKITNVELTVNGSEAFSRYFQSQGELPDTYNQVYIMQKELKTVLPMTFYDVAVVGENGRVFVSNGSSLSLTAERFLSSAAVKEARQQPNRILYCFVSHGITKGSASAASFMAIKALTHQGAQKPFGFACVVLSQGDLQAFFGKLGNTTNNLLLMDQSGNVVSSVGKIPAGGHNSQLAVTLRQMQSQGKASLYANVLGKRTLILQVNIPRWNLHLVSLFDYTKAAREFESGIYIFLVCFLVTAAVLIAVFYFISEITRPISRLAAAMEDTAKQGLPKEVNTTGGGRETRQLSKAFNVMVGNLNGYVHRLLGLEEEKRRMEIHALQMQINPHFIYNTLISIKWLIWQDEPQKAVEGIDTFTQLLRGVLSNSNQVISVAEEVQNLENYIFLQKIRFGEKIQTNVSYSSASAQCCLPKVLLQPLLENAFFHAFTGRTEGVVSAFIDRHGDHLICEIIDDGVGMTQAAADALLTSEPGENGHSIGIWNVNARILLLYGKPYGVKIFSEPGHGTLVRVTLPVISQSSEKREPEKI
ncbi:sensor histidine kinase [Caproicibacterium argilliputei]|uniref:Sensor histidine kinase n=1 Tax=Caproicibacterium argilliputei TaxID=3030016 RepID=A0AA97D9W9_9FIRM|nr:sensor histidine kinase [Caproicibacterium argilliputei]WOC32454.1 sensor histidine kinase [Caproicibacterium argilliputei]